jgi:hypothetical protein
MSTFKPFAIALKTGIDNLAAKSQLYTTSVEKDDIWAAYLTAFPEGTNPMFRERTEHDCSCCRQFVKNIGNVVGIIDGKMVSVWDTVGTLDEPYAQVARTLSALIRASTIKNIYLNDTNKVGTATTPAIIGEQTFNFNHFHAVLPSKFVHSSKSVSIDSILGDKRTNKEVFKRAMDELTLDAGRTILELINDGSLYRGQEQKGAITEFIKVKAEYDKVPVANRDTWCWAKSADTFVVRIRNTAIGTLLIDISADLDLDAAVTKFEKVMAPANYKRPNAVVTKVMIEQAEKTIVELGFENSLVRRHATISDITVNDVLYVDRDVKKGMATGILSALKEDVVVNVKSFSKVAEVSIEDFVSKVLPGSTSIEVMMENRHQPNLVSVIAPTDKEAKSMLKWNNNFSWSYNGNLADSDIKANVAKAGGKVDGVLRFSISWNDKGTDDSDLDAWCTEPSGNKIGFSNRQSHKTGGNLDVDIRNPNGKVAVENITFPDIKRVEEGEYTFFVNQFANRHSQGFRAEIEFDGELHQFEWPNSMSTGNNVVVAKVRYSKAKGFEMIDKSGINGNTHLSSKDHWGVGTNKFTKVEAVTYSPNYWDGSTKTGNKHWFFILSGCNNPATDTRGHYNEFLKEELTPHRKVFEVIGAKMAVKHSDQQLSGLGFSSTIRNDILIKVKGATERVIRLKV